MFAGVCFSASSFANQSEPKKPISKAFLTYLAELEQVDGKWIHPTELVNAETEQTTTDEKQLKTKPAESGTKANKDTASNAQNKINDKSQEEK